MTIGNLVPMTSAYSGWGAVGRDQKSGGKRRSHIEVEAAILRALVSEYLTINQLAIRVNLNRVLAKNYVKELSQKGRVESKKTKGLARYSASQNGVAWLKRFETLASNPRYGL